MIQKNTKNTKSYQAISLLNSFSNTELEHFKDFLASPYFNKDQWVIQLFQVLKKQILNKQSFDDTNQLKVFKLVFPQEIVNTSLNEQQKKLLGVKMSVLTGLAKRFLINEALATTPSSETELLCKQLLEKKQSNILARTLKKQQQILSKNKRKGVDHYAHALQVELGQLNHLYQDGTLIKEDNFQELIEHLDLFYIINKLRLQVTMISIAKTTQKKYDLTSYEKIESLLNSYETQPIILIYQSVLRLMSDEKEITYFKMLSQLEQHHTSIPKDYLKDFYYVAANFCVKQSRTGKHDYNNHLLDLYKIMDRLELLLRKKLMPPVKLKNLVIIACRVAEFSWAKEMIEKYHPFIKKDIQQSVYHYNLGVIDFYKKNYKTAISHFIRVEKINLAYDFDCRLLLLQAHYQLDTDYDERTMQIFRSAEQFVNNNKVMPFKQKKNYKNFIQMLISLYRIKHQVGKKTLASVERKMSQTEVIMAKEWLLEKIAEFKSGSGFSES